MKKTPIRKISEKKKAKIEEERAARRKEYAVFEEIWKERHQRSEISNAWLGNEAKTVFFHHIFAKSRYPQLRFEKENIIQITFAEHQKVEQDPFFYEEVNKRRELIKDKFLSNDETI